MRTKISWLIRCFNSTRFLLPLGVFGVAAIFSVAIVLAVTAVVPFELEGNATDNSGSSAPDDWQTLAGGGGSSQVFTGIVSDPGVVSPSGTSVTDATTFTGGGSKDILDISSWAWGAGSIPPKDDITNAYAAAYAGSNQHQIIVFGADRFSQAGNADLGFWFFQNNIAQVGSGSGGFSGVHAVNDILVLANFEQDRNTNNFFTGSVEVLAWQPACNFPNSSKPNTNHFFDTRCLDGKPLLVLFTATGSSGTCGSEGSGSVCAITNGSSPVQLYWGYAPKTATTGGDCTSSTNCAPPGGFFEGAIDVNALIGDTCISSFMAETRSSTSESAVLEDFTLHSFNLCGISIQKSCPTNTLVHTGTGDTFQYTFGGVVRNTGFGTLHHVTVIDSFPSNATQISPAGNITCPAGSPAGAICYDLGDLAGQACKLWPNNTTINCATLVSGADPNASTDFASNTFRSPTNGASDTASVHSTITSDPTSLAVNAGPVTATCPVITGMPAINVDKTCTASINSNFAVSVDYSGHVCNESNLTLTISSQPTDVQLIPSGTAAKPDALFDDALTITLQPCTTTPASGSTVPPCQFNQNCTDAATCTPANNLQTGTNATRICTRFTGSYSATQASSGSSGSDICLKDRVTVSARSALFNQSTGPVTSPAASCPLCPGGTCVP